MKSSAWSVLLDGLAYDDGRIMLLSVAGPETAIKAVHACLGSSVNARFEADVPIQANRTPAQPEGYERPCPSLVRDQGGYQTFKTRLNFNVWHFLAISEADGLMPCLSETALNRELRSPRFTTPYLREWVPWLAGKLAEENKLSVLDGFQTRAALLKAGTPELDELVSVGLREGFLSIPRKAVA